MTPREVIARAIAYGDYGHYGNFCEWEDESPDLRAAYFNMADAVIDALDEMEMTGRMIDAAMYCTVNETSAASMWQAMVRAMRDE